MFRIQLVNKNS